MLKMKNLKTPPNQQPRAVYFYPETIHFKADNPDKEQLGNAVLLFREGRVKGLNLKSFNLILEDKIKNLKTFEERKKLLTIEFLQDLISSFLMLIVIA